MENGRSFEVSLVQNIFGVLRRAELFITEVKGEGTGLTD